MSQIDSNRVASALAYCEAHCDTKQETEVVEWVAGHIGDAVKRGHPRFNVGEFLARALPIQARRLKSEILNQLGVRV